MAGPSKRNRRPRSDANSGRGGQQAAQQPSDRSPEWYAAEAAAHPQGNMSLKTLRIGFDSETIPSDMITLLTAEARRNPTLMDRVKWNTQTRAFREAKMEVLDTVSTDPTFAPYFSLPGLTQEWKDAALNGLWTFANKDIMKPVKLSSSTGGPSTPTPQPRIERRASTGSNKSAASTVGATAFGRMDLFGSDLEITSQTAQWFTDTRMNFFLLPDPSRLFSLRVSSIVKAEHKGFLGRRIQGVASHNSLDFQAFRREFDAALVVMADEAIEPGDHHAWDVNSHVPIRVVSNATLADVGQDIYVNQQQEWNFVVAHKTVMAKDPGFLQFCAAVRGGDTRVVPTPRPKGAQGSARPTDDKTRPRDKANDGVQPPSSSSTGKPGKQPIRPEGNSDAPEVSHKQAYYDALERRNRERDAAAAQDLARFLESQANSAVGCEDDIIEQTAEHEMEAMRRANAAISKEVALVASRISEFNYRRASQLFNIPYATLTTSYGLIPFPPTWKLSPTAALYAHQWLLLSEALFQSVELGGGVDGSSMGVGKTHAAASLAVLEYWIVRLHKMVAMARANPMRAGEHHPQDYDNIDTPCPTQASYPLPCPCAPSSPIRPTKMKMPSGPAFISILARTGGEWVKCLEDLFTDAPLLDDDFMPMRIRIDHKETLGIANSRALNVSLREWHKKEEEVRNSNLGVAPGLQVDPPKKPQHCKHPIMGQLGAEEMSYLCRRPDFADKIADWKAAADPLSDPQFGFYKDSNSKGITTKVPRDATFREASYRARQYIILTTPTVMLNRVKQYVFHLREIRNGRSQAHVCSSPPMLDCGLYIWDEAHNYQHVNLALKTVSDLQAQKRGDYAGDQFHYWMLSGTIRENGPYTLANHIGTIISKESWSDNYAPDEGEVLPDPTKREACLRYLHCWLNTDDDNEEMPYVAFINEYKLALMSGKDKDLDAVTKQPNFVSFTQKMAEIVKEFVIERGQHTRRLDAKPLLDTAKITLDSCTVPINYSDEDITYLSVLKKAVDDERDKLYNADLAKHRNHPRGPEPKKKSYAKFSGFYDVVLASTTPGIVRWVQAHPNYKSLRVHDIKDWQDDPATSPLYKDFDSIIKGDEKWVRLMRDIDDMEASRKTAKLSEGAKNKCMIGVRLPAIAHLYAMGLARRFKHAHGKVASAKDIEDRASTTIHARMKQQTRTEHIDVFNTLHSDTRYFVCTVDVLAEGVNMTGANHVIVVDPHPRSDKVKQFKARPNRFGQREDIIHVRQYYNTRSPVDSRIMVSQDLKALVNETVSTTVVGGGGVQET